MERLFLFFYQYRSFFTFLLLEVFCAWLIIRNNQYQGASFFNSSNILVASLNSFAQDVREYFLLRDINSTLAEENAYLRTKLEQYRQSQYLIGNPTITDSAVINQFDFVSAKVINNSVSRVTNYLTINKGENDGIQPGMAVISPRGVVGKVKAVSSHYSVVTSVLHVDVMISVLLKRTGDFGTARWDGVDPDRVSIEFVPRHVHPVKGDTVITSGFNSVYPEGIMVGVVDEVHLREEALFYDLKVKLLQDFRKLSYVEVVRSLMKNELDSLQQPFLEGK